VLVNVYILFLLLVVELCSRFLLRVSKERLGCNGCFRKKWLKSSKPSLHMQKKRKIDIIRKQSPRKFSREKLLAD
jgi:hypothetical protein